MNDIRLFNNQKQELPILSGIPDTYAHLQSTNGQVYHTKVGPEEYVIFQNFSIGQFTIRISHYFLKKGTTLYSEGNTAGAAFQNLVEGAALYSLDAGDNWLTIHHGEHNILSYPKMYCKTIFQEVPAITCAIHFDEIQVKSMMNKYPLLKPMLTKVQTGINTDLYQEKAKSSLLLRNIINKIMEACNQPLEDPLTKALPLIAVAFDEVITNEKFHNYHYSAAEIDTIIKLKIRLDEHYADKYILQKIYESAFMNKGKFRNGFTLLHNATPKKLHTDLKIQKAKAMLTKVGDPMTNADIAAALEFDSGNYFSSIFLKYTGMRPTKYRQVHLDKLKKEKETEAETKKDKEMEREEGQQGQGLEKLKEPQKFQKLQKTKEKQSLPNVQQKTGKQKNPVLQNKQKSPVKKEKPEKIEKQNPKGKNG